MSGIILYKSKYGATKQYADWIAERTGFSCIKTDDADMKKISSFLKKNIGKLKNKKTIVFCCGASPYEQKAYEAIMQYNFKGELTGIPCFYCRGTFDMSEMSFKDRTLCKMLRKAVAKKNPDEYEIWEKALMAVGDNEKGNWIDKAYIEPIIEAIG